MEAPCVYDHYAPGNSDHSDGVYRVVGVTEDGVTLLQVGDADGKRVHTGKIVTVSYSTFNSFAPVENPDENRPLGTTVASVPEMVYWSVRVFVQQLAAHPMMAALALVLIATGYLGGESLAFPDLALDLLILIGCLALAYIGTGRL